MLKIISFKVVGFERMLVKKSIVQLLILLQEGKLCICIAVFCKQRQLRAQMLKQIIFVVGKGSECSDNRSNKIFIVAKVSRKIVNILGAYTFALCIVAQIVQASPQNDVLIFFNIPFVLQNECANPAPLLHASFKILFIQSFPPKCNQNQLFWFLRSLYHINNFFASKNLKNVFQDKQKGGGDKKSSIKIFKASFNDKLNILFIIKKGSIIDFLLVL